MSLLSRTKNIWAWGAYHPSESPPEGASFTWTGFVKPKNQKARIIDLDEKPQFEVKNVQL